LHVSGMRRRWQDNADNIAEELLCTHHKDQEPFKSLLASDHQMLQWTAVGSGLRFMGLVHHTDAEREWAYDRQSHIGQLDKALDEALARGWTVVDMKQDWKTIFRRQPCGNRYVTHGPSRPVLRPAHRIACGHHLVVRS
jgi:hypothetical protein